MKYLRWVEAGVRLPIKEGYYHVEVSAFGSVRVDGGYWYYNPGSGGRHIWPYTEGLRWLEELELTGKNIVLAKIIDRQ